VNPGLDQIFREAGGRIVAALASRYRDLNLAEEALAEACLRAATIWPRDGSPQNPAGWLYRVAERLALDALRRQQTRERLQPDMLLVMTAPEDVSEDDAQLIPDERLRLIFVCCHPAIAADARAALTLRLICGLSVSEIARAFLVTEPTLAQRLVRAKRKIAETGVSFEIPRPSAWFERLEAVLSTIEIAYAKAHEDAAGVGPHAGYAREVLELTRVLADLLPKEPEVLALAATVRYAEARRPARVDKCGMMVPLSEQDPMLWHRSLIKAAEKYLKRAAEFGRAGSRTLQAAIHGAWCERRSLAEPAPWPTVLSLYNALLAQRDDPVVRLNRAVALAEVVGVAVALQEVEAMASDTLARFPPYFAVRADLLRRSGRAEEARSAYAALLDFGPSPAEKLWLEQKMASLAE
jgi:RNA polymerase sigma-70 factor (ECF subfamily)